MRRTLVPLLTTLMCGYACGGDEDDTSQDAGADETSGDETGAYPDVSADAPLPRFQAVSVLVRLDGQPSEGASVSQGGREERWTTGPDGRVTVEVDRHVPGDIAVIAANPEARTEAALVWDYTTEVTIDLERYDPKDNEAYVFQDPGSPMHSLTSAQCGHCHKTIAEDFFSSRHPWSASNPVLQDLYAGVSTALKDEASCQAAGGKWWKGRIPGKGLTGERCYLGDGTLPAINEGCGHTGPCDEVATSYGGCADCHAPGIDGKLGGRDLLEAGGFAYERGIHCDVCHHVESVDGAAPAGVAGRLRILRPSDPSKTPSFGDWRPLLFGPHDDIPNPFMGIVPRAVYRDSAFCAGCHQLEQEVLVPGAAADPARWPGGKLPVHTTYSEWQAGSQGVSCQGCHMPPDPDVENTADLQLFPSTVGVAGGWPRPKPAVRRHAWLGPRSAGQELKGMAATVELETTLEDGTLTVTAETRNVGAGHALPTGEPLRSIILRVEAFCGDARLEATGGDVVPDFGGALDVKTAGDDFGSWPGAAPGDLVRVVSRTGELHDYAGPGPFGDGTFDAQQKGMPVETFSGQAKVVAVDGDLVTFDADLPDGDVAYRVSGAEARELAGAPGFGFARVLTGPDGRRMVPHFLAVDVASDNRLLRGKAWKSKHVFVATCEEPAVKAALLFRLYPLDLAKERGWEAEDRILFEADK